MGNLKIGNSSVTLKLGSTDVSAAYIGNTLVYSGGTPPTPVFDGKFFATYSDSTTYSAACDSDTTLTTGTTKAHTTPYSAMTSAEIGSCITSIGNYVFQDCSSLTSVTIPNSVTYIGYQAFGNCSGLTNVTIPSGVKSIDNWTFGNCSSLSSVTMPNNIRYIGDYVFFKCHSLSSIDIPSGVTSISQGVFSNCYSLTSIDIPNSVTTIGNRAFQDCTSLSSVTIPNSVTSIGDSTFSSCSGLTSVTIGSGVTTIGECVFYNCGSLSSVTIPNSVSSIGNQAFESCTSFTSVTIGNGVTSIDRQAFQDCSSLTSVTVEATTPPTLGFGAFLNTNSCPIYVPSGSLENYKAASGWSDYASRIQAIPTPVFDTKFFATYSDSTTYSAACDSDTELTTATTQAHTTSYDDMTTAEIGSCITTIGEFAFDSCSSLTSVTIGSGVTTIGDYAFSICESLTSVTIPNSVTTIGDYAFANCISLTSVTIEATTPPTLDIGAFEFTNECPIYVPSGSVETYKAASGWSDYASRIQAIPTPVFDGKFFATYSDSTTYSAACDSDTELTTGTTKAHTTPYSAMTTAEIGSCITSIGEEAFYSCTSLTSVTIGSGVTTFGDYVFCDCTSLTSVTIPNGVTSIGEGAFSNCSGLTSVTIGSGVTTISDNAFNSCSGLTSITVESTTPPTLGYNVFTNTNNCPIYVPSGSVETYKSAWSWSKYARRIQAIP